MSSPRKLLARPTAKSGLTLTKETAGDKITMRIAAMLMVVGVALMMAARADGLKGRYDVVIAGAGTGGTCAAIQAARMGSSALLIEETDWIGGQMNAAAVTSMDEGGLLVRERGIYREFCERVEAHYRAIGKTAETAYFFRHICLEPRVGRQILDAMINEARKGAVLDVALRTRVIEVTREGNAVTGVVLQTTGGTLRVACPILIDATEWGDVIPLTGARYRVGNCTSDSIDPDRAIQFLTWTAVIRQYPNVPPELRIQGPPPGYTPKEEARFSRTLRAGDSVQPDPFEPATRPWTFTTFVGYRGMPDSASRSDAPPITRTHMNFNNDYPAYVRDVEDAASRLKTNREAQLRTLYLLYYIQHTLGKTDWSVANDEGFDTPHRREDVDAWLKEAPELEPYRAILLHFSIMPYARESRRIIGLHTLSAREIERKPGPPKQFPTTVALGDYPIDLHGSMVERYLEMDIDRPEDIPTATSKKGSGPFAIPFECFIPEKIDGFLAAEKNISQSRLANGATRLQPSTMLMGQAAGAIAALALKYGVPPRRLDPVMAQQALLKEGATLLITPLRDVARDSREWPAVQLVAAHGMLPPENGRFGPEKPVSGEQLRELMQRLFDRDAPASSEPVTRGRFAEALRSGVAGTPVTIHFVSDKSDADLPITRSEAAQVIAEFMALRATTRMTGAPQRLAWETLRPATPPPPYDVSSTLHRDLQRLMERKVIDDVSYWMEHAIEGQWCDGALVGALMAKAAQILEPGSTAAPADVFARHHVISRPEYWSKNAQPGGRCPGQTVAVLIANLARRLNRP